MSPAGSREEQTVQFDERLDQQAATHARAVIEAIPQDAEVILDFTSVRDIEYGALASVLAAMARHSPRPVALRGLCDQHIRLLRYLGMDPDELTSSHGNRWLLHSPSPLAAGR
ncbi:MAG TPA: hypothetical protein VFG59_16390 [Anaeromyxobacter sp.]|nr:hypothetical protein [Anaeromyxobacter sp.]